VLIRLGRRAISLGTSFFALLGFVAVPLGDKTAYQHVASAISTPEGKRATAALGDAYEATKQRLFGKVTAQLGPQGDAAARSLLDLGNGDAVHSNGAAIGGERGVVSNDERSNGVVYRARRKHAGVSGREER